MQKFTRALTREITVAGERLAVTMSEEGLSIRPVGSRRPPLTLSWPACVVAASGRGGAEPSADEVSTALEGFKVASRPSGRKPAAESAVETVAPAAPAGIPEPPPATPAPDTAAAPPAAGEPAHGPPG